MGVALLTAFVFGFLARAVGLPPLVGYLLAGFVLHAFGYESTETIETISEIGIFLLLFGIGLKLRLRTLTRPVVWVTSTVFAASGTLIVGGALLLVGAIGVPLARDLSIESAIVIGFALSFSSTVFAVKTLEQANETGSLAGRIAVGVLILQDAFAVIFLVVAGGNLPSVWAIPVVAGLIGLRPIYGWLLKRSGHGEVLVLFGFALAVGVGAGAFDLVGLKPDLGALVAGLVLSGHPRSTEMADRLLGFKDLFLVGFFLLIGLEGIPSPAAWVIGLVAVVLMPARSIVFFWLFTRFRLRIRTALHGSLALSTFSEFGLIVGSAALAAGLLDGVWVSTIAVAVAGSLVVASALGTARYRLYDRWSGRLIGFEQQPIDPDDAIIEFGDAQILIFGMGRVGTGAYDEIVERLGSDVVGVDRSDQVVSEHLEQGRNVVRGDALDRDFWERVKFHPGIEMVMAAMSSHHANLQLISRVKEFLPRARIAAIATFPDQVAQLREVGVDVARNLYEEAGQGLADDAVSVMDRGEEP